MFGPSDQEKKLYAAQERLANQQYNKGVAETEMERKLFDTATGLSGDATKFFKALLDGDTATLTRLFAPSIENARATIDRAQESILRDIPAGGERNLILGELETSLGDTIGRILSQAPQAGAEGLTQIMATLLGVSPQYGSVASQSGRTASLANYSVLQNEAQRRAANAQVLGSLIGDVADLGGRLTYKALFSGAEGAAV